MRSKLNILLLLTIIFFQGYITEANALENEFTKEELYKVINSLPEGYKVVFNLYAIEGYKHKEIAEMLNINQNTSKSQYSRAKEKIRQKLESISKIRAKNDL